MKINIDVLIESTQTDSLKWILQIALKKVFLNKRAKLFYTKIWHFIQLNAVLLLAMISIFFISKSKMPSNTKFGTSIAILLMVALFAFLLKVKVRKDKVL